MVRAPRRVEGKSEAEYIRPRTKVGLDLPIHELETEGANGNVSTVVKGNSGSGRDVLRED
jgi:hypothetical protein